ncbi:MAG: YcaO-like family protein [Deltaproteobacteria bacterium]|nr:YcaO-like family protein [Deltaproteobacteria bacterium]
MSTLNESLADFSALVDSKTGIIRSVSVLKLSENDPPVFLAHSDPCDTAPITGMRAANRGAACSVASDRALVRACGESIERYSSAIYDPRSLRLASFDELTKAGERAIRVDEIYQFREEDYDAPGFPYQRAEFDTSIRWVKGQSLSTEEPVWLPASCVYVPYLFDKEVEPWTHMPISTGLAAGRSLEQCIYKGIYEIIERDALMISWLARLTPPRIDAESCRGFAPDVDRLLDTAQITGGEWFINQLTLDVDVPVIGAALIDPGDPPRTSFGIAASDDVVHAVRLALEEAALTRTLVNRSPEILDNSGEVKKRMDTLRGHLIAHATSSRLRDSLRFLTDDGPSIEMSALVAERAPLEERLASAGLEAFWVDVTTDDLRSCGFHVTRAIVPGMQPLDNDHRFRYLGGDRLHTVPSKLGHPVAPGQFNPDPHPFP